MIILSIHDGHNASAALLIDGKIVGAVQEERFTRIKNDFTFPNRSIKWLLNSNHLYANNISKVVLCNHHMPYGANREQRKEIYRTNSNITKKIQYKIYSKVPIVKSTFVKIRKNRRIKELLKLNFKKSQIIFTEHHQLHAETAYFARGKFDEPVLVFTNDGSGDNLAGSVSIAENGEIKRIISIPKEDNLGSFYAMITYYLGMVPLEHEYKVMGLAPYTSQKNYQKAKEVFSNLYSIGKNDLKWKRTKRMPPPQQSYKFFKKLLNNVRFDIVSAGAQALIEEITSKWVHNVVKHTGIKNVIYSGGVVMNVKANKKIWELDNVDSFWAMPSGGDESNPIGGCYGAYYRETKDIDSIKPLNDMYLGPEFDETSLLENIDENKYQIKKLNGNASSIIADLLSNGEIVARSYGKLEFGPRALGNRSILADPSKRTNIKIINDMIKGRDFWMPFAVSLLDTFENRYIINPKHVNTEYMINTFDSTENINEIICGTHQYDKTTRPQIVRKSINNEYYEILNSFQKNTNIGGVMNTSFNLHGFPIILTHEHAFYVLENSGLYHLQVGNHLISKIK
ncbi:hypothetical protein LCGC14_1877790 [marine sediment metagenome]|uniref:Carbamoyltransferase n=1 Tax=marine sediment metagenome TaxID=412755 RepID=A0A0F9J1P6_9ZZZZ